MMSLFGTDTEATMAQRMTAQSLANLKVADRLGIEQMNDSAEWLVWVERAGNRAFVSGVNGPIRYKNYRDARRAVNRLRPDIVGQPTI
jgi:hypothetical protein